MKYSAYIFDLDGTLLDTICDLTASCNYALRIHNMPERSVEEVRMMVGNGVKKLMERAVPGGQSNPDFESAYEDFRKHYLVHSLDTTQPYPGVLPVLSEMSRRGAKMAVVSNKFYAATQGLVEHFFGHLIHVAIGQRDDIRKKPAPDTIIEAMRQLDVSSGESVYVGDSDVDILTARNSHMPCLSVSWGFRDRQFLVDHGAIILLDEPRQLLDY